MFGEGEDELEHAVLRLLIKQFKTVATAEWGSGGTVGHWLAEVPESGGQFRGGIIVRDRESLRAALGVAAESEPVEMNGAEQDRIVGAMAEACRQRFAADYVLAVGPLPVVKPDATEPPLLHLAVAGPTGVTAKSFTYAGHPDILRPRGAKQALNLLRLTLLKAGRRDGKGSD